MNSNALLYPLIQPTSVKKQQLAKVGSVIGRIILKNNCKLLAPSINADSSSSLGIPSNVVLNNNLVEIQGCAFESCVSLEEIAISKSVQTIGNAAFYEVKQLSSIEVIIVGICNLDTLMLFPLIISIEFGK